MHPKRSPRALSRDMDQDGSPKRGQRMSNLLGKISDLSNVDTDIGVVRSRRNSEGMPLELTDFGDVEVEPLSCLVLEGRFIKSDFHRSGGVHENSNNLGCSTSSYLTEQVIHQEDSIDTMMKVTHFSDDPLNEVGNSSPNRPSPRFVP